MNRLFRKPFFLVSLVASLFFGFSAVSSKVTAKSHEQDSSTITSVKPYIGMHIGDTIVITGTGFDSTLVSNNKVSFNGQWYDFSLNVYQYDSIEGKIISVTSTSISVIVPFEATSGNVTVSVNGQLADPNTFYYAVAPTLTSFSPTSGNEGDTITITGTGFDPHSSRVSFTGERFPVGAITATPTSFKVIVPADPVTGPIIISCNGQGVVSPNNFTVLASIYYLDPWFGEVGSVVVIKGALFDSTRIADYKLTFNGVPAKITQITSSAINTTVPLHASTGPVVLTYNGKIVYTSGIDLDYTVDPTQPHVNSYSVYQGTIGTPVTIIGTGFDQVGPPPEIYFGGVKAPVFRYNSDTIYTAVPKGAQIGKISVSAGGLTGIASAVFWVLETINYMEPRHAKVGDTLVVRGTGFYTYYALKFTEYTPMISVTDTSMVFVVPPDAFSGRPFVYGSADRDTLRLPYLGIIPTITSVTPDTVFIGRNQTVTINGTGLATSNQTKKIEVVFMGNAVQKNIVTNTLSSISATVPIAAKTGPIAVIIDSLSAISSIKLMVLPDTFPYTPLPPQYGGFENITTSSFTFSWSKSYRAIGYLVDVLMGDDFSTFLPGYNKRVTTDTLISLTGLLDGTNYVIEVYPFSTSDTSKSYGGGQTITLPLPPVVAKPIRVPPRNFDPIWFPSRGADDYTVDVSDNYFETFISGVEIDTFAIVEVSALDKAPSFQYRVRAHNLSGFSAYSNVEVLFVTTVTEVAPITSSPALYPNPSNDFVMVTGISETVSETSVIDAIGRSRSVRLQKVGDAQFMLDTRGLTIGLYILNIVIDQGALQFKFIKQ